METLHDDMTTVEKTDALICSTKELLYKLYAIRNALAPINARLPVEILCEIFLYLPRVPLWTTVTSVCHYWRDSALQCPQVWSSIDIYPAMSPEVVNSLLLRSKQAPLVVKDPGWMRAPRSTLCILEIFGQLGRIRELQVCVSASPQDWRALLDGLNDAPILETLRIKAEIGWPLPPFSKDVPCFIPRLRRLQLYKVPSFVARRFIRPTLIEIKLEGVFLNEPAAFWISTLGNLPNLQCLELTDVKITDTVGPCSTPIPQAHFPCLRTLTLQDFSDQRAGFGIFLQHSVFPASTTIVFRGGFPTPFPPDSDYYDPLHAAISAKSQDTSYGPGCPLLSCRVSTDPTSASDMYTLWRTEQAAERMLYAKELLPHPAVSVAWARQRPTRCSFFRSFSLSHLRTLYIDNTELPEDTWRRYWGALLDLHSLCIRSDRESRLLLSALTVEDSATSQQVMVILPRLEELTLARLKLSSTVLDDIHRMLRCRKAQGVPLQRLFISEGRGSEPQGRGAFAQEMVDEELLEVFEWEWDD